jgi:hypothetical protein
MNKLAQFCVPALVVLASTLSHANAAEQVKASEAVTEITLKNVNTAFAMGEQVGTVKSGPACSAEAPREFSPLLRQLIETELAQVFKAEFAAMSAEHRDARLPAGAEVSAFINDLDIQACSLGQGAWQGEFKVQVGWQVTSSKDARTLYQASTSGTFSNAQAQAGLSPVAAMRAALKSSVKSLTTDHRFAALLRTSNDGVNLAGSTR